MRSTSYDAHDMRYPDLRVRTLRVFFEMRTVLFQTMSMLIE